MLKYPNNLSKKKTKTTEKQKERNGDCLGHMTGKLTARESYMRHIFK